jgi:prepilin-type processing-associated H-X9-DG protein
VAAANAPGGSIPANWPEPWTHAIAPFVEQKNSPYSNPLAVFNCPQDPRYLTGLLGPVDQHGYNSYLACAGNDPYGNQGIFPNSTNLSQPSGTTPTPKVSVTQITDGSSNTIMLAERPPMMLGAEWGWGWWASYDMGDLCIGMAATSLLWPAGAGVGSWTGAGPCTTPVYYGLPIPAATSADTNGYSGGTGNGFQGAACHSAHPWSFHTGGAHFLFGDGSARFISYSAGQVLVALGTRAGGETFDGSQIF